MTPAAAIAAPHDEPPPVETVESTPPDPVVAPAPQPSPETTDAQTAAPVIPPIARSLPSPAAPEPLSPAVITLLNQRGQQMVDLNDYSAAPSLVQPGR